MPIDCFASFLLVMRKTYSSSAQRALFQMGEAALETFSGLSRVHQSLSNKHCLGFDPGGLGGPPNRKRIFLPTDDPFGCVEAVVARNEASKGELPDGESHVAFGRLTSIPPMRRLPTKSTMAAEPCARLQ